MKRIYVPYLVFASISITLFTVMGFVAEGLGVNLIEGTVYQNVIGMLYGNSRTGFMQWNQPLWFLPCLLSFYFLANAIECLIDRGVGGGKTFVPH